MLQSNRVRARALLFSVQLVSCVAFVAPWQRSRGFPLDDAWIHHVVARTFAATGTLGYSPGAHGAGATSYLWAALLGVGHAIGADPVVFTAVLAVGAALAAGQLLLSLLAPEGDVPPRALFAVALAVAGGDFTWFAFSGMEATLVVALALGAIVFATREGTRAAWTAGALAGLCALARPDFVPLGGLLAALAFLRTRRLGAALPLAVPWALACALYFGSNALLTGHAMPATLRGRRWLWIDSTEAHPTFLGLAADFLFAWAYRLRQFTLGLDVNAPFWAAAGLALFGAREIVRERRTGMVLAVGFALFHLLVFLAILPVPGHGGRYQPLVPVLFVLLAAHGTAALAGRAAEALRARGASERMVRAPAALAAAAWLACAVNAWWEWRGAHGDAVAHVRATEMAAGQMLRELPAEARIASFDVGGIGYFSGRRILDLGALTDSKVVDVLRRDEVVGLLRDEGITHLVLPSGEHDGGAFPDLSNFGFRLHVIGHPEIALATVRSFESEPKTWLRGVWFTQNATYRQLVHEVRFTECRAARASGPADGWALSALGELDDKARAKLEAAFATAASRGLCVRASGDASATPREGCWTLHLGAPGPLVATPAALAGSETTARETLAGLVAPYVKEGDLAGAAAASLHALANVTRDQGTPCFWTPLPPLERPVPRAFRPPPTPRTSALWGAPLALAVAALSMRAVPSRARSR